MKKDLPFEKLYFFGGMAVIASFCISILLMPMGFRKGVMSKIEEIDARNYEEHQKTREMFNNEFSPKIQKINEDVWFIKDYLEFRR